MTETGTPTPPDTLLADLHEVWFGSPAGPMRDRWFDKRPAFDAMLRNRFGPWVGPAAEGAFDHQVHTIDAIVAATVLLDQIPRNAWRQSARSFAYGDAALRMARRAISSGLDQAALPVQRMFLYLPFEHSEALSDQNTSIALFEMLNNDHWLEYAHRHRDIIRRFGRFPHRNAILGRPSTDEEIGFLRLPGSSF